ncbi:MAG TPA: hypothetical protein VHA35_09855 [Dongiaceae bacterium]|jgi:hypothetical protein|nr:hypothetical protein [Dongiaceae bacterium]
MFDMAKTSILLFLQGRLFQDPIKVAQQVLIGAILTAVVLVVLVLLGLPLLAAAAIAGLVGGAIQPYLFRNLKYR